MVEDPRVNFAISARGARRTGINHLGLQVDTDDELKGMREQLAAGDAALVEEKAVNCCYAKSDKYWITDLQGIACETWHNLGSVPMFGDERITQYLRMLRPAEGVVSAANAVKVRSACCT